MRPGRFHPGNAARRMRCSTCPDREASMRPGRFHPGNYHHVFNWSPIGRNERFNEAGAFPPRKFRQYPDMDGRRRGIFRASMRPGRFHPGNLCKTESAHGCSTGQRHRFNEAGAFPPRKSFPQDFASTRAHDLDASMRPGRFHPGNAQHPWARQSSSIQRFNEAGAFPPRKLIHPDRMPAT